MTSATGPADARIPWAGITIVCAGALPAPLDTSVNVAFPVITEAFALPQRVITPPQRVERQAIRQ